MCTEPPVILLLLFFLFFFFGLQQLLRVINTCKKELEGGPVAVRVLHFSSQADAEFFFDTEPGTTLR